MQIDEDFFEDNMESINKVVSKIILFMGILPPLFYILSKAGVFQIGTKYTLICAAVIYPFTFLQTFLVYSTGRKGFKSLYPELASYIQHFAKYFGLIGTSLILALLGTHAHIGIYISYALMVFMSCLYYNPRTTRFMAVICYLFMLGSLYLKSYSRIEENLIIVTVTHDFIAYSVGFTIEFIFVFLITDMIAKNAQKTLNRATERNNLLENTQTEIMKFIPKILESHELFTGHHVKHTVTYVDLIAREIRSQGYYQDMLTEENIGLYAAAANLHDIGKVHIPDNILNKPGKYTAEEYEMMKRHPAEGRKLIESLPRIRGGLFNEIAMQMAYYHHEKYDGTGYPSGISGKAIPLCARIMAAADVLDACLSWRPYKEPYDIDRVMEIFQSASGTHFEPCIVDAVVALKPIIYMMSQDFKTKEQEEEEKEFEWRNQLQEGRNRMAQENKENQEV